MSTTEIVLLLVIVIVAIGVGVLIAGHLQARASSRGGELRRDRHDQR